MGEHQSKGKNCIQTASNEHPRVNFISTIAMNKILRSTNSYPYPRTHTVMVLPSSRHIIEEKSSPKISKSRPPLNRAIPTIPESKSNDSMTVELLDGRRNSIRETRRESQLSTIKFTPFINMDDVGESRLQSVTKVESRIALCAQGSGSKSPLLAVANNVKSRLSKLGNRFGRTEKQNIRSSTSLTSMRKNSDEKVKLIGITVAESAKPFKKSVSMESQVQGASNLEMIKSSIPIPMKKLRISSKWNVKNGSIMHNNIKYNQGEDSRRENSVPYSTRNEKNSLKIITIEPQEAANDGAFTKAELKSENSDLKQRKIQDEPNANKDKTDFLRVTPKLMSRICLRNGSKSKSIKWQESLKENENKAACNGVHSSVKTLKECEAEQKQRPIIRNKIVERSFIPLKTSKRMEMRQKKILNYGNAPLAERESSRVENSPAVELPPFYFEKLLHSPNQKRRILAVDDKPSTVVEESTSNGKKCFTSIKQTNIAHINTFECGNPSASSDSSFQSNNFNHREGWLIISSAGSSVENNRGLIDDEIRDQPLLIGEGYFQTASKMNEQNSDATCEKEWDANTNNEKSQDEALTCPIKMISSLHMSTSGYLSSSALLDSPTEESREIYLNQQSSDVTTYKAGRAKSRGSPNDSNDNAFMHGAHSATSHIRPNKVDDQSRSCIAFPDFSSYESSCQDVAAIKSQVIHLKKLFVSLLNETRTDQEIQNSNDVDVLGLIEENIALKKELANKDRIINELRARLGFS